MSAIDDNKNKQSIDEASQAAELGMETAGYRGTKRTKPAWSHPPAKGTISKKRFCKLLLMN